MSPTCWHTKKYVWIKTYNLLHKNDDINIPPSHSLPAATTKCTQRFLVDRMKFRSGKWQGRQGDWPEDTKEAGVWDKILCQNGQMTWQGATTTAARNEAEWMGQCLGVAGASRFTVSSSPFYTVNWRLLRDCTCSQSSFALLQSWNSITPCAGAHTHALFLSLRSLIAQNTVRACVRACVRVCDCARRV